MSTRLYEGMFLFDANLAGKDWTALEKHVDDLFKKHAATLVHSEKWPDRKLAYEIKGCKKGTYYLTYFNAPPSAITGLERDCRLSDRVLRVLVLQESGMEEILQKRLARLAHGESATGEGPGDGEGEGSRPPRRGERGERGGDRDERPRRRRRDDDSDD